MFGKVIYKPYVKQFLGKDIRIIKIGTSEYVVVKDIFYCLDRLDSNNQITSRDRKKLDRLLSRLECASTKCTITSKSNKNKSRETQEVECIPLEKISMVTISFEPQTKDIERNRIYNEFLQFVDYLLEQHNAHNFIVTEKERQSDLLERYKNLLPKDKQNDKAYKYLYTVIAEIVGCFHGTGGIPIWKGDITVYEDNRTVKLLITRLEIMELYIDALELSDLDFKFAYESTIRTIRKRIMC